jgi:hypothetical protein
VSVLADFYINFSWYGVVLGMAFLGMFAKTLYFLRKRGQIGSFFYVSCFPAVFAAMRSEVTMLVQWVVTFYVLSYVISALVLWTPAEKRKKKSARWLRNVRVPLGPTPKLQGRV